MILPSNILKHELIGLRVTVVSSSNTSQNGIEGEVENETMNTITVKAERGSKIVQKTGAVFRFRLVNADVDVDGDELLLRPEDRIKKRVHRW
ncbi:MAG: ribonuclease P protein component 1 [Candidatus Aenigmarchaeota archaeon]|nr:ribonuclease P protein component 1 [Candidatus Aenigmarchaeota archaeon]